jgi:hypothetical protein
MCQNQTFHTSLTVGRLLNDPQMRRFLQRTIGLAQLLQQQPGLLEVKRVETLGKPAIDRRKQFVGLPPSALIKPQTRHARRCAQLPGLCLLLTRNAKGPLEMRFRFRQIRSRRQQGDFAGRAMHLGLGPSFLGRFHGLNRFVNATPTILELPDQRMGVCQESFRSLPKVRTSSADKK